jgi:homoaconitate hydratase
MPQTIVEKISQAHLSDGPKRVLRAGDFVSIHPLHVMTHDNTSAVISKFKSIGAKGIFDPKQLVFALDHDIQNRDEANLKKYRSIEVFAKEHRVDFYPAGSGIGHQLMIERGYVVPGSFVVASDSHSNMYGALGAVGTPIVRTDAAAVWSTGEFWWQIPRTIQVVLEGKLPEGVTGKDVIITLCGLYNHDEALNAAVEFSGLGVTSLPMDARFSISNMSTEWGPIVGWFPVDEVTIRYLRRTRQRLLELGVERFTETDIERWSRNPPHPDPDAQYSARIRLDLSQVTPHVSGPDTVQTLQSLAGIEKKRIAIHKAYLVSCVNSRIDDLEVAAWVLSGKKVSPGVKLYVGAASAWTQQEAEKRGVWQACSRLERFPFPRVADRASDSAPDCWKRARSASPPPTGISKAEWDRARHNATSPVPKWSPPLRLPDTSADPVSSRIVLTFDGTKNSQPMVTQRNASRFCQDSPSGSKAAWYFCHRTMSTPTRFTARITPIAMT